MRTLLTTLHSKYIHASLSLPYLAAYCGEGCGELLIREFTIHEPKEQVLAALLAEQPEVVAFSVYLWNRREILELADALATAQPEIRIVLGGPEVSFSGAELFAAAPGVTALVRGEGEEPLRRLLTAWAAGEEPGAIPRVTLRSADGLIVGPDSPPLPDLDAIPSPFASGLVELSRGLVYYETSRGCPYSCAFCMSALDATVRSFSLARIQADLGLLMAAEVPQIKLVDRTFNYDPQRARAIWAFILEHNRSSHFHFEIGAHLLDAADLALLATVPADTFQFEIGVQSTLPATLAAIGRRADLERLEANVRQLRTLGNIHLHLDLIFGLPEEGYDAFLTSLDRVANLAPHHLQIEPVKLLPGAPLRLDAPALGLAFDPHPPYAVLTTPLLDFAALERLRGIGRLLDLTYNSGKFTGFLAGLASVYGSLSAGLEALQGFWQQRGLFRHPLGQREIFERVAEFVNTEVEAGRRAQLRDQLARDYARCERVTPDHPPSFFVTDLTDSEAAAVRTRVRAATEALRGQGIKLQHFVASFGALPEDRGRTVRLFLYLTAPGRGLEVREVVIEPLEGSSGG